VGQRAVDDLWGYTDEIFEVDTVTAGLIADGVAVDPTLLREEWHAAVSRVMAEADLSQPSPGWSVSPVLAGLLREVGVVFTPMTWVSCWRSYSLCSVLTLDFNGELVGMMR